MISAGTVAVSSSVAKTSFFTVPPGPATLLLANAGTVPVFVGAGTGVTTANGFPVQNGVTAPVVVPIYAGNPGQTWAAVTATGTSTLSWMISGPSGGTGTGTLG